MNELVFTRNNQVVTSSRNVARDFGKEHHNVVKAIEGIVKNNDTPNMFYETTYIHEQNKQEYRQYLMNRDGFTLLVMGFTGKKAMQFKMKYIQAFNEMEKRLKEPFSLEKALSNPDTIIKLATNWKEEKEKREKLEVENKELKPKATYHDLVLQSDTLLSTTQVAKDFGMGAPTLNKILHELGVQYKKGHRWFLYHKYQDKGYAQSKTFVINAEETKDHLYWTQKGRLFIHDLLKEKKGIFPVSERGVVANG